MKAVLYFPSLFQVFSKSFSSLFQVFSKSFSSLFQVFFKSFSSTKGPSGVTFLEDERRHGGRSRVKALGDKRRLVFSVRIAPMDDMLSITKQTIVSRASALSRNPGGHGFTSREREKCARKRLEKDLKKTLKILEKHLKKTWESTTLYYFHFRCHSCHLSLLS